MFEAGLACHAGEVGLGTEDAPCAIIADVLRSRFGEKALQFAIKQLDCASEESHGAWSEIVNRLLG